MPAPSTADVRDILSASFPLLASARGALQRLVATWQSVRALSLALPSASSTQGAAQPSGSRRPISLRDLVKWCRRVEALLETGGPAALAPFENQLRQEQIFEEACDVFLGAFAPP